MSLRTLLSALCFLCLFCSSAQAQTTLSLDDTLVTVTVAFDQWYPYSITSFGLPQGTYMPIDGMYSASYFFGPSSTYVQAVPYPESEFPPCAPLLYFNGVAGPITAPGTYPMSTTSFIYENCSTSILTGTGEIVVSAVNPAPTPEPISGSLMAIGFAMLALRQRFGGSYLRR